MIGFWTLFYKEMPVSYTHLDVYKRQVMSKAFTRETDGDDEEEELDQSLTLPQGTRNYITPGGYARIREELEHLLRTERPHVVEVVHWAASNGDRSENGDYIYGKRRLREIDRRIRFLTRRLDLSEVVDPARQENADQVFFGATVTLCDEQGLEPVSYTHLDVYKRQPPTPRAARR